MSAIKTAKDVQIIFLDTPGLHESDKPLNRRMMKAATDAAADADLLVFMTDAGGEHFDDDLKWAKSLLRHKADLIVAINKIDLVKKITILPMISRWSDAGIDTIYPISSKSGEGVDELELGIIERMPFGPALFPEDALTEQSERFLAAETIREKLFRFTHMEIPYSSAVIVDEYKARSETLTAVQAVIYVEKDSQKSIVIGQNGSMIKRIGTAARLDMEEKFGGKFFLELKVKTRKDWTREENFIKRLGERFGS